jgi:hypothetical protein
MLVEQVNYPLAPPAAADQAELDLGIGLCPTGRLRLAKGQSKSSRAGSSQELPAGDLGLWNDNGCVFEF